MYNYLYLLKLGGKIILIDTSSKDAKNELLEDLKKLDLTPEKIEMILLTHNHWDHNGNNDLFPNAKIYDSKNINKLSIREIKVLNVPGHTKDSIAFLYQDILFSGDTIFHSGGIGRTDFPESVPDTAQPSDVHN